MGRWVERTTYWQGDVLDVVRHPFTGWCVEGTREVGGTAVVTRIVSDEAQTLSAAESAPSLYAVS